MQPQAGQQAGPVFWSLQGSALSLLGSQEVPLGPLCSGIPCQLGKRGWLSGLAARRALVQESCGEAWGLCVRTPQGTQ